MHAAHTRLTSPRLLALLMLLPLAAGCVDTRTVFKERELTAGVPAEAAGFLGFSDTTREMTVCGNCHIDKQTEWKQTAHAHAWATLQQSGGAQPVCEACHSVNGRGNPLPDSAHVGYLAVADPRYVNVQCESCHGPGLTHVSDPKPDNVPLASVAVGVDLERGCGECHNGTHHPFVEEWSKSPHSQVLSAPAGRPECQGCHIAQGALDQFNVETNYIDKDSAALPITCAVCHDPHRNNHPGQLRLADNVPDPSKNLCMRCHNRRGGPDPADAGRGPHACQGRLRS